MELVIENISKAYGALPVLNRVNMVLQRDICYCLMSPSGTGKTTLLRILMGLEKPDSGSVYLMSGQRCAHEPSGRMPLSSLRVSAVFQEDRLCSAFTPIENVMLASRTAFSPGELRRELSQLLPEECLTRPVSALSGGMKRRTALLRALLAPSDILLMDEPFTGLDDNIRRQAADFILRKRDGRFLLVTTHHEDEAEMLGGRIIRLPSCSETGFPPVL